MPASAPTAPNGRSPGNVLTRCRDPDKPVAAAFSCQQTQRGGGEAQKVAIGRAMAQETSVLPLDEPTSNLDLRNQLQVLDIIKEMAADRGVAAVVTMHGLNLALRFADKFILMRGGTIWDVGGREIITAENIKSVYSVDVTVAEVNGRPVIVPV